MKKVLAPMGVSNISVDLSKIPDLLAALRPETKMIFVETPTNPTMKVADIAAIAKIGHERGILTVRGLNHTNVWILEVEHKERPHRKHLAFHAIFCLCNACFGSV